MALLLLFALVAGAGTALTPCVLPILPAVLSAGAVGGRRRPLGIVVGLGTAFTLAIVALASVVRGVGLASGATRTLAIVVLIGFGALLFFPDLAARVEAPLSRLGRFGPRSRGDGFWSGLGVGAALGLVCTPCAGPILAAVISVSASRSTSLRLVAVAIAYTGGLSAMLLLYTLGGRRLLARVRRSASGPRVQRALGAVLVATGVAMAANLDVRFEQALAQHVPSFLRNPTKALEDTHAVQSQLAALRGHARFDSTHSASTSGAATLAGVRTPPLPRLGEAPDFVSGGRWFNTPGSRPLTLAGLRGRVVLVDFWTYTCINCIRTLPFLRALDARYRSAGLTIVGVHTPEFSFEHEAGNVATAIRDDGLRYPVMQDNDYATWTAWGNQYWPAEYLIDAHGQVRHTQFGEGDYKQSEAAVRALLLDAGARSLPAPITARPELPSAQLATPETYLGAARAERIVPGGVHRGTHDYPPPPRSLGLSDFALSGRWTVTNEAATAVEGARIDTRFQAAKVYLVMSSAGGRPRNVRLLLDGRPLPQADAGPDVRGGIARVGAQRLYSLVSLAGGVGRHRLTLELAPGLSGYAFTFG